MIPAAQNSSTNPTSSPGRAPADRTFSRSITARVPMAELLAALGFQVNLRTHRSRCVLHGGENPTAFSWREDGRWHCFNCGAGGDQIALVRTVRDCGFREALAFLAELAGVPVEDARPARAEIEKRRRTEKAASTLEMTERALLLGYRAAILRLEKVRAHAGTRIAALEAGATERFPRETEAAWSALAAVAQDLPRAAAAYSLLAFSAPAVRAEFVLHPGERAGMIERFFGDGYVVTERGARVELLL